MVNDDIFDELNHKDIQADYERELIDDIIQKYKKYKECISKLENKIEKLEEENKKLKNKITLN